MFELKKGYQDIAVEGVDLAAGRVRVVNRNRYRTLAYVTGAWRLLVNGQRVQEGQVPPLETPPLEGEELTLPLEMPPLGAGEEAHLTVEFALAADAPWAEAGHVVAWEQFPLPLQPPPLPAVDVDVMPPLSVAQTPESLTVSGEDFEVVFDGKTGALAHFVADGKDLLAAPLEPNFWRSPVGSEFGIFGALSLVLPVPGAIAGKAPRPWRNATAKRRLKGLQVVSLNPQVVQVTARWMVKLGRSPLETRYTVYGSGDVVVESSFTPRKNMPRFGIRTEVPGRYDCVTWFGRGPHENYVDRKEGAAVGIYSAAADELLHDYLAPQENGHRTDVRWVTLTDADGKGLLVADAGGTLLGMNVWPYTLDDLDAATHIHKLPRRENLTLCIDYRQRGVGSFVVNMMRKDDTLQENRRYSYSFRLRPYHTQDGPPERNVAWSESVPPPEPVADSELVKEKRYRATVLASVAAVTVAAIWMWLFKRKRTNEPDDHE